MDLSALVAEFLLSDHLHIVLWACWLVRMATCVGTRALGAKALGARGCRLLKQSASLVKAAIGSKSGLGASRHLRVLRA